MGIHNCYIPNQLNTQKKRQNRSIKPQKIKIEQNLERAKNQKWGFPLQLLITDCGVGDE